MTTQAIDALLQRMDVLRAPMDAEGDQRRCFLAVYIRTTRAVKDDLAAGGFVDPEWAERWDIVFADLYLGALRTWNETASARARGRSRSMRRGPRPKGNRACRRSVTCCWA